MGDVAVDILNLRQVLLGHMHKLRGAHLIGKLQESLINRWRVILLVVVLLSEERETRIKIRKLKVRNTESKKSDVIQRDASMVIMLLSPEITRKKANNNSFT